MEEKKFFVDNAFLTMNLRLKTIWARLSLAHLGKTHKKIVNTNLNEDINSTKDMSPFGPQLFQLLNMNMDRIDTNKCR